MMTGSLRSRWQFSKSAHSSISFLKKWKKRKMYDIGEMKISPGDPRCGCQGHYCMPHPHTWGPGLCWTSSGTNRFSPQEIKDAPITLLSPLLVPRSCTSFLRLPFSIFLVLTLNLVFALRFQNHPSCRTNFFRLLDERSTENMKNVVRLEKQILSQQQMQLLKSSWRHFGLFNHLNDEIMQECARRMRVGYCGWVGVS